MPSLLAIETSSDACSVALAHQGGVRLDHREAPRAHARLLLPMIDALLTSANLAPVDLDGIVYGRGPGSFTGLRIGCAVTQGLAWAHDLPVLGLSSLAVLAQAARASQTGLDGVVTLLDARMGECYGAAFAYPQDSAAPLLRCVDDRLGAPAALLPELSATVTKSGGAWCVVGDGAGLAAPEIADLTARATSGALPLLRPGADALLALAASAAPDLWSDAASVQPVYLRDEHRWQRQVPAAREV